MAKVYPSFDNLINPLLIFLFHRIRLLACCRLHHLLHRQLELWTGSRQDLRKRSVLTRRTLQVRGRHARISSPASVERMLCTAVTVQTWITNVPCRGHGLQSRPVWSNRRPPVAVYRTGLTGNRWKPAKFKFKFKIACLNGSDRLTGRFDQFTGRFDR